MPQSRISDSAPLTPGMEQKHNRQLERTHESREIHEKKSAPDRVTQPKSTEDNEGNKDVGRPFVLLVSFCSKFPITIRSARRTSDPAHGTRELQPKRDGRVRCMVRHH